MKGALINGMVVNGVKKHTGAITTNMACVIDDVIGGIGVWSSLRCIVNTAVT